MDNKHELSVTVLGICVFSQGSSQEYRCDSGSGKLWCAVQADPVPRLVRILHKPAPEGSH